MKTRLPLPSSDSSLDIMLARQIIERTKSLFPYPTNICNVDGIMVASTTPERIGSYHEGAVIMIRNNLDELAILCENQYEGTKKGVSRPVRLNKKVIGAIGLTGDVEKVAGYSKLLQAFTELLIENSYASRQARLKEESLQSFLVGWLSSEYKMPKQDFIPQMQKFGFNWTGEFSVIIIKSGLDDPQLSNEAAIMMRMLHRFMMKMDTQKNLFTIHNLHIIWVTTIQPGKKLRETTETLLEEAKKWEKCPLFFGIGKNYESYQDGRQSYSEAVKAVGIADVHNPIVDYCKDIVNIILYSIPEETKREYIDQIFSSCKETEVQDVVRFITAYSQCNGSITKIAKRLHMHKNTVQYRISKISQRLGFDIRSINNQLRLQMACEFLRKKSAEDVKIALTAYT